VPDKSKHLQLFYLWGGWGEGLGRGAKAAFREENMKTYIFQLFLTAMSHRKWHSTENSSSTYEDATFITIASYIKT